MPRKKPNKSEGLPNPLQAEIENLTGCSMDAVKIHFNSPKPDQLKAKAYAQGSEIHITPEQEQHLPKEAWHVIQEKQRKVQPTMQMKEGEPVNDDKSLEKEADKMGEKAAKTGKV